MHAPDGLISAADVTKARSGTLPAVAHSKNVTGTLFLPFWLPVAFLHEMQYSTMCSTVNFASAKPVRPSDEMIVLTIAECHGRRGQWDASHNGCFPSRLISWRVH